MKKLTTTQNFHNPLALKTYFRLAGILEKKYTLPVSEFDKFMGVTKFGAHQVVIEHPQAQGYNTKTASNGREYLTKDGQYVYYLQKHIGRDLAKHYTRLFTSGQRPDRNNALNDIKFNIYAPGVLNVVNWANNYNAVAGFQWVKKIKDPSLENYDFCVHNDMYRVMYEWFKLGRIAAVKKNDKIITQIRLAPSMHKNLSTEKITTLFNNLAKTVNLNQQHIRELNV